MLHVPSHSITHTNKKYNSVLQKDNFCNAHLCFRTVFTMELQTLGSVVVFKNVGVFNSTRCMLVQENKFLYNCTTSLEPTPPHFELYLSMTYNQKLVKTLCKLKFCCLWLFVPLGSFAYHIVIAYTIWYELLIMYNYVCLIDSNK